MSRWIWLLGLCILLAFIVGLNALSLPKRATSTPPEPETFKDIHVEILNGCGKDGMARQVGQHLRTLGFDVMTLGNAGSFNYPETIVIDRAGKPEYARRVAESLGTRNRIQQIVADPFRLEEVTVIVGRDYKRLALPRSQ